MRTVARLAWLVLSCVGCAEDPRVRLDVLLQTDHRPGIDFVEVRTRVLEGGTEEDRETTDVTSTTSFLTPRDAARFDGLPPAVARQLVVELLRSDGSVLQSNGTTARNRSSNQVRVTICSQCQCPESDPNCQVCPLGERCSCGRELCVPDTCAEDDDSCALGCRSDRECQTSELACVDAVCREGACLRAPVDALCRASEVCDIDDGCVPDPRIECIVADDCPAPRGDCADRVCAGGRCGETLVPEACGPSELCVEGRCAAMCATDEDCVPADACSTARCTDGTCASVDACGTLGCDPELGCVPRAVRVDVEDGTSSEAGATSSVLVRLTARPTEPVRVLVFASDRSEARPEGATLTELVFDADTWRTPQRVTFVGEDDDVVDGDRAYEVVAVASSAEVAWEALRTSIAGFFTADDEVAAVGVRDVRLSTAGAGCARTDSEVWCWGRNHQGLLGVDPSVLRASEVPRRIDLGGRSVEKLDLSSQHACIIDGNDELLCWGRNLEGQLGDGSTTSRWSPQPVVGLRNTVVDVVAGGARSCAIEGASLFCWGGSSFEPLGDGTEVPSLTPVEIRTVPATATLGRGERFFSPGFVLRDGAAPLAWGPNGSGQLGTGSFMSALSPTATRFPPLFELVGGFSFSCGLRDPDRRMLCAGNGSEFGSGGIVSTPVLVESPPFRSLALVAGLDDGGGLWRWGLWWYGTSGLPLGTPPSRDPSAPTGQIRVTSNGAALCLVDDAGRVSCDLHFPTRERGRPREALGPILETWSGHEDVLARSADPALPVLGVEGVPGTARAVATSGAHTCYVDATNTLWCLGANDDGQLGRGTTSAASQPPASVPVEGRILHVAVGESRTGPMVPNGFGFSCASSETQTWWWGEMVGAARRTTPTALTALDGRRVVDLEAGGTHACAVVEGGELHCWGYNHAGQLGAPLEAGFGPHLVSLSDVVDVDLGTTHTCALTTAGEVWCFGDNQSLQFAPTAVAFSADPVRIDLPARADRLVVGHQAACARVVGGDVWCWGDGGYADQEPEGTSHHVPRRIPELTGAEDLAAAAQSEQSGFCGRFADGALRCFDRAAVRLTQWMYMPAP